MNQIFFKVAFALSGDTTVIQQAVDPGGSVSFTQGWGPDYALDPTINANAKDIDRGTTNWLFLAITEQLQQYQVFGTPEFISQTDNGGTAFSYDKNARVRYRAVNTDPWHVYISKADANTDLPSVAASWIRDDEWLTSSQIAGTYLTQTNASTTYETQSHASSTYATQVALNGVNTTATNAAATANAASTTAGNAATAAASAQNTANTALSRSNGTSPSGNISGSRAFNTNYQNLSGHTLKVSVEATSVNSGRQMQALLNGTGDATATAVANESTASMTFQVPNGFTYSVSSPGFLVITSWSEL